MEMAIQNGDFGVANPDLKTVDRNSELNPNPAIIDPVDTSMDLTIDLTVDLTEESTKSSANSNPLPEDHAKISNPKPDPNPDANPALDLKIPASSTATTENSGSTDVRTAPTFFHRLTCTDCGINVHLGCHCESGGAGVLTSDVMRG
jgi:hypothetical protein